MKSIVLGAGGHLGNAIVRELCQRGWTVTAATRDGRPTRNLEGLPVTLATGEFNTLAEAQRLVDGHHLVVDAASPYMRNRPRAEAIGAVANDAFQRLEHLLDASHSAGACLGYISSFTTLGRQRSMLGHARRALLEELHPYFQLKEQLQAQVVARASTGLETVIVVPTACFGPWDPKPLPLCFLPLLLNGFVPASSNHPINILDVRDLAALMVEAVEQGCYHTPIALSGHNMTVDGLVSMACRFEGVPEPTLRLPTELPALAAHYNERLAEAGLSPLPYPSLGLLLLLEQHWTEQSAAQRALGVKLRPASRTIVDAIDWYRARGLMDDVTGVDVIAPLLGAAR